ncbi:ABC transporter ATP-binding protein [Azorhizobium oxalatiphilum]|uniref:ABC transporter ATP-binding protein n=1 Tax=Azorhizobium oxalatiphilum TaxID=980631 RepID=A0A917F584_9HYPH|nr:ABC transporter ATP-binding protein [Azorhizobium oxalatiphilum]GGF51363.1 ABC transporter ATP-binding protein [Azorhizobium oxalatiphilum]
MRVCHAPEAVAVLEIAKPAVEFKGVRKVFQSRSGPLEVLRDFSLTVGEGEFLAVVGPSGSGKSTVLNLLAGLDAPDEGVITCNSRFVDGVNTDVGYLTQHDSLLPWRTVEENVAVPLEIRGVPIAERRERVGAMIAGVGLKGFERHYPSQLSGGMRKRAMLARTLIYDPATLLMDEPFGPLDAQLKLVLQAELMRLWSESRKTVIFVTHDIVEAITLADRVVVLSPRPSRVKLGERIAIGRPRSVHDVRFAPAFEDHYRRLWGAIEADIGRPQHDHQ